MGEKSRFGEKLYICIARSGGFTLKTGVMKILDCTLRDGGYYTHWDFDRGVTDAYLKAVEKLPIDCIEIGYRQTAGADYIGQYGYTPIRTIEYVKSMCTKRLAIMLNEKDVCAERLKELVKPLEGLVDTVRIAVAPENVMRALSLCAPLHSYGMHVAFNVMYMSKWDKIEGFYDSLSSLDGEVDVLTMVDSYGGAMPTDVAEIATRLGGSVGCQLGFHGHNNLQLALINTITATENGVEVVDSTMLGMGRGAGNLNTELLLTWLNREGLDIDFTALGDAVAAFAPLYEEYGWGTQLPYMISGAHSLPQKEVMELVTNRVYSFESIVRGLQNRKDGLSDNAKYPVLEGDAYETVVIVGGGDSVTRHIEGLRDFVNGHEGVAIVFATARHSGAFESLRCAKYYCLVGREAKRLAANSRGDFADKCVLPPYPRKLGTEVPGFAVGRTFELPAITFTSRYVDSCTTLAVETALLLNAKHIYTVGYDGYGAGVYSEKEIALTRENRAIFGDANNFRGKPIVSLTPTLYGELKVESLYGYLSKEETK